MQPARNLSRLPWFEVVRISMIAALQGDRDTVEVLLEANNGKLDHFRDELRAVLEDVLCRRETGPDDGFVSDATIAPFTLLQGGQSRMPHDGGADR